MSIIYIMLPIALLISFSFLAAFLKFGSSGQYEDLETPPFRMLIDDEPVKNQQRNKHAKQ